MILETCTQKGDICILWDQVESIKNDPSGLVFIRTKSGETHGVHNKFSDLMKTWKEQLSASK